MSPFHVLILLVLVEHTIRWAAEGNSTNPCGVAYYAWIARFWLTLGGWAALVYDLTA
jgi:hypothetical protein